MRFLLASTSVTLGLSALTLAAGAGTVRNMVATSDGRLYLACSGANQVDIVMPEHMRAAR